MKQQKIYAYFDGDQNTKNLSGLCIELLAEQKNTWHELQKAYENFNNVKVRDLPCKGFSVRIQHNPKRITSSTANINSTHINKRPCFLCLDNLPEAQKGILYRNDYLILCNPAPVFFSHLTISCLYHRPQTITEHIDILIQLAFDLNHQWTVLYNGPRCGASAPDHLHFQAIPSGLMPIEKESSDKKRSVVLKKIKGVTISCLSDFCREVLIIEGSDMLELLHVFKHILSALTRISPIDEEPMINVIVQKNGERLRFHVFPRAKHRPEAFFKTGNDRILISPAVIEMGGVIITPVEKDFERLRASDVEGIYREVSLGKDAINEVLENLE